MLNIKRKDKIKISEIWAKTQLCDIGEMVKSLKWSYVGHIWRGGKKRWERKVKYSCFDNNVTASLQNIDWKNLIYTGPKWKTYYLFRFSQKFCQIEIHITFHDYIFDFWLHFTFLLNKFCVCYCEDFFVFLNKKKKCESYGRILKNLANVESIPSYEKKEQQKIIRRKQCSTCTN